MRVCSVAKTQALAMWRHVGNKLNLQPACKGTVGKFRPFSPKVVDARTFQMECSASGHGLHHAAPVATFAERSQSGSIQICYGAAFRPSEGCVDALEACSSVRRRRSGVPLESFGVHGIDAQAGGDSVISVRSCFRPWPLQSIRRKL